MTSRETGLVTDSREPRPERPTPLVQPRPLTFDERQAAEAAYRGRPLNPAWPPHARIIYRGIVSVLTLHSHE